MQSKKRSITEVCCNTGTGILTAYLTWIYLVNPSAALLECDLNALGTFHILLINGLFTVVSVVRGYVWRRFFNMFDSVGW